MDSLEAHARRERLKHRANWIIAIGTLMGAIATLGLFIDAILTKEPVVSKDPPLDSRESPRPECERFPENIAVARTCWRPQPLLLTAECRYPRHAGYSGWQDCPANLALDLGDKFRLRLSPQEDGYLYVWELEAREKRLSELRAPSLRVVRRGDAVLVPQEGISYEIDPADGDAVFVALLTEERVEAFERITHSALYTSSLRESIEGLGRRIRLYLR